VAFLGIDAGASATKWTVFDGEKVLASGHELAMDAHLYREDSVARLREVIHRIADATAKFKIEQIFMGITGYSEESDFSKYFGEEFAVPVSVTSDIELAYRANFGNTEGVLIYAGTGSVAFTLGRDGKPFRIGGWGYLLGDEGAGYWIGREAIRAAMLFIDGQVQPEAKSLESMILAAIKADDWSGVKSFVYGNDRGEIAALSKVVAESAEMGDPTAIAIMKESARHLSELVYRTEETTGRENLEVNFAGGVSGIKAVADELQRLLGARCSIASADIALEAAKIAASMR
jgi:N-acetylglucosamine kinase-like BadF-type ATPase